jgi:NAD(P)-dependent dehydrogenase (short-subunit alcohol dehydrogenase family)
MSASKQRTAIITGAAHGIGLATAHRIAETGARLALVDLQAEALEKAADNVDARSHGVLRFAADVTDAAAARRVVDAVRSQTGSVDILVNVAGGAGPKNLHQIDEIEPDVWDHVIALNLRSTYLWCREVVPLMREQGYGRIINTSSTIARGRHGPVGTAGARLPYAAAKAGILGLTSQLAKDVGQFGITVNAVLPWLTLAEPGSRLRERFENLPTEARNHILGLSPMRRPAEADEVAAAIAFLASESAGFVSGVGLPVDGAFL